MRKLRGAPAIAVAVLALLVAIGGGGYAIGAGFIGTGDLKNQAVTNKKIKKNDQGQQGRAEHPDGDPDQRGDPGRLWDRPVRQAGHRSAGSGLDERSGHGADPAGARG